MLVKHGKVEGDTPIRAQQNLAVGAQFCNTSSQGVDLTYIIPLTSMGLLMYTRITELRLSLHHRLCLHSYVGPRCEEVQSLINIVVLPKAFSVDNYTGKIHFCQYFALWG